MKSFQPLRGVLSLFTIILLLLQSGVLALPPHNVRDRGIHSRSIQGDPTPSSNNGMTGPNPSTGEPLGLSRRHEGRQSIPRLAIYVLLTASYADTRGQAIMETWGLVASKLKPHVDVYFATSLPREDLQRLVPFQAYNISIIPAKEVYYSSLYKKSLSVLSYFHDHLLFRNDTTGHRGYDYVMKADDDLYININMLYDLLPDASKADLPGYFGRSGGLNFKPFPNRPPGKEWCGGGAGYILSREALKRVRPHLSGCIETADALGGGYEEDLLMGQCMAIAIPEPSFRGCSPLPAGPTGNEFVHHDGGEAGFWKKIAQEPSMTGHDGMLHAVTIHKVNVYDMYRIHALWGGRKSFKDLPPF